MVWYVIWFYCMVLRWILFHFIALQCIAWHFIVLYHMALYCIVFDIIAVYCMSPHCILWYGMVLYFIWSYCTVSHCYVPLLQCAGELPRSASSHFLYFLQFFEKYIWIFWKNYPVFSKFPQPNFAIWLCFLAIFHTPWTSQGVWKIAKPPKNCIRWPLETLNRKMTSYLVFDEMGFSLHNTVIMPANGPKCLRTE